MANLKTSAADVFKFESTNSKWRQPVADMEGKEPIRDGRESSRIKQNIRKRGLETTNEYIWKIRYLGLGFRLNSMPGMKLPVTATSSPICCRWNIVEGMLCFHDLLIYVVLNDTFSLHHSVFLCSLAGHWRIFLQVCHESSKTKTCQMQCTTRSKRVTYM